MRILKTSLVAALAALLVFSNIAPAFAAAVSVGALKNPSTTAKTITPAAAAPKTPAKAVPAKVVPAKVPVVPKIIKPPVPVSKAPVAPKAGIPVVPSTPPVVPALPNPPPQNTSIIDMINTIPVIGAISRDDEIKKRLEVVDPFTDVATMPGGKKVYRQYSKPRSIYQDRGQLKLRPENWNLFAELPQSQLFDRGGNGYRYSVPMGDNSTIEVRPGNYVKGATTVAPVRPAFKQSTKENSLVSEYIDMYPEIDVRFTDSGEFREREIIIKRQPRDLQLGQDLIFWEEYSLPANAEVEQRGRDVLIKKADGTFFAIGGATVLDASVDEPGEMDMSVAVKELSQEVYTDYQRGTLNIGIHLDAAYLLDEYRIYPVTIDPIVGVCQVGCAPSSDNYLRYLDQTRGTDTNNIYLGYYNVPANNPNRDPSGPAPRIPIIRYNQLNYSIPPNERLDSAYLKMAYFARSNSYCNLNQASPVTVAKRITGAWNTDTITYRQIRGMLADANPGSTTQISVSPGQVFSWNITDAFQRWMNNSATNYGILIHPTPDWQNDGAPNWPQCIHMFNSIERGSGPYIEVNTTQVFPDLSRTNIVIPNTVRQGARLTSTFTVINNGSARSVATDVQSFFGVNSYENGLLVNTTNVPALDPGQSINVTVNYDIPVGQAVGNYLFSFWIDRRDLVLESNEGNNKTTQLLSVTDALRPDIRVENASINNNSVLPGDQVTLTLDVYNRGAAIANSDSYVYYYFNRDSASYSANRKLPDDDYFSRLDVNQFSRESVSYTIPAGTAPGTYYLSYFVDGPLSVTESNENNNQGSFQITVRAGQDLVPSNVQVVNPRRVLSGEQLQVNTRIQNSGNVAANNLAYLYDIEDINTGIRYSLTNLSPATLSLATGYDNTIALTGTVPANIPLTGSYQMRIQLDPNNNFAELVEGNNVAYSATILTIERNGYCGGCGGGGGGNPPPSNSIPDSDGDHYADLEEKYAGLNVNGSQSVGLYDLLNAKKKNATQPDQKQYAYAADPINIRTGGFEFTQEDFSLKGRGVPISIARTYNSRVSDMNNRLGNGWNLSTQMFYYQDSVSHNVQVYLGGALISEFSTNDGGVTFIPPYGVDDTLVNDAGTFTYRTKEGTKYIFGKKLTTSLAVLNQVQDTFGNTTTYTYTTVRDVPLLTSITDASGRVVTLTYGNSAGATWDKIVSISENLNPAQPHSITYVYDGSLNLTEVHDTRYYNGVGEEFVRRFSYNASKQLITYTDERGTILYNTYDANGRVIEQYEFNPRIDVVGTKRMVYGLIYSDVADAAVPGSASCTSVNNYRAANNFYTEKTCFDANGLKIYFRNGAGEVTNITYDAAGMPLSVTDGNRNIHRYTYDNRRRVWHEFLSDTADWSTEIIYTYDDAFNRLRQKQEIATSRAVPALPQQIRTTTYVNSAVNGSLTSVTDGAQHTQSFGYDNYGNVISRTDKNGVQTTITYDANSNYPIRKSTTVVQADGSNQTVATQFAYDVYGNPITVTSPRNNIARYEYDTAGNVRKEIDALLAITTHTYDLENHRIQTVDKLGHITNYVTDTDIGESELSTEHVGGNNNQSIITRTDYDWLGNATRSLDARGTATSFTRDGANRITHSANPLNSTDVTYDANGNKVSEVQGVGTLDQRTEYGYDQRDQLVSVKRYAAANVFVQTIFTYDGLGRKISETDPNGSITRYEYDLMDRLIQKTDAAGNVTRASYDNEGNKVGELSPRAVADAALRNAQGNSMTYYYDGLNRKTKTIDAQNHVSLFFYDQDSHVVRTIDRQNSNGDNNTHVSTAIYDELGRPTRTTDALGSTVNFTYDAQNNVLTKTDEMSRVTRYTYDIFGSLVTEQNPAGNISRYTYDANGNKLTVTLPDGNSTTSVYDTANHATSITDNLNQVERFVFDAVGNNTRHTDKRGLATNFTYNNLNRLVSEANPLNVVTTYTYDNNGNKQSVTADGVATAYQYDALNRVTRITHPANKTETFHYDANGNVDTKTDGALQVSSYTYNALDRLTNKHFSDNTDVTYTYDNWGNQLTVTEPTGTVTNTYDALGRQRTQTRTLTGVAGQTYAISRDYNADSQLAYLEDAAQKRVNYSYNNNGLLQNVSYQAQPLVSYAYNSNNNPTTATYRNGIVQNYGYDGLQRVQDLNITNAQNQSLFHHVYSYDATSNRTQTAETTSINGVNTNRTIGYGYDDLHELTSIDYSDVAGVNDLRFGYDARGNRLSLGAPHASTRYSYTNGTEELASIIGNDRVNVAMTYDGNGSLTREAYTRLGQPVKNVDYSWSARNLLSQIRVTDTSRPAFLPALPTNILDFTYDDNGDRVKKTVNNTDATYYLNNGLVVLNELSGQGAVNKTIVQGLGGQIAEINAQGVITFMHTDVLGSPVLLTNEQGSVTQQFDYDAYGSLLGAEGTASQTGSSTKYLFTGQEFDVESNLAYYNARYYNPLTGRFIARDDFTGTTGDSLSRNNYIYVQNNPLRFTDPTGHNKDEQNGALPEAGSKVAYVSLPEPVQMQVAGFWSDAAYTTGGVFVGAGKGLWGTTKFIGNGIIHPIDTTVDIAKGTYQMSKEAYNAGKQIYNDPSQSWQDIKTGTGMMYDDFMAQSPYERGQDVGMVIEKVVEVIVIKKAVTGLKAGEVTSGIGAIEAINIDSKIAAQMLGRGWTAELISNTSKSPFTIRSALNKGTGNPSTAYYMKDGSYVVIDNVTKNVVQVSNRYSSNWIPDSTIVNPYLPKK